MRIKFQSKRTNFVLKYLLVKYIQLTTEKILSSRNLTNFREKLYPSQPEGDGDTNFENTIPEQALLVKA